MSFNLFKELEAHKEDEAFISESFFGAEFSDMLSEDKQVLQENVKQFVAWARNLIDRPVVNANQIERDPTVDAKEAKPFDLKDEKDAFAKLAKTVAGLVYFMKAKVQDHDASTIARKIQGDKTIDSYVKHYGVEKGMKVINLVTADLKTKNRSYIKSLLKQIEEFYKLTPSQA